MVIKRFIVVSLLVAGFVGVSHAATEKSIREVKTAVAFCMTDYELGLLPDLAQQIYGDEFFKYNEKDYWNYGYKNGYRSTPSPIFWGDTNTHWGTNPNPRYLSVDSITHQFVSFYHGHSTLNPEIHFLGMYGEKKVQSVRLAKSLPTLEYKVVAPASRDKHHREIVNSERVMITGVLASTSNTSFQYQGQTILVDFEAYAACLREKIGF